MSNKKLAILGIIAAVMLIWAVAQSRISKKLRVVSTGLLYLVSGVNTDDVGSIEIKSSDKSVTLKRQSKGFVVADKDNYPAELGKINSLITDCLELEISRQIVTDNPANHADLGLTEENANTIVRFLKPDSSEIVGIVIGNTKESGQGTYVRLASKNEVYVALETPWIESEAINYIKQQLVSLVRMDIAQITVNSPEGKYILKPIADSEDVEMVNIPAGKKLKQSEAKNVFTALSSLNFTDVMKKTSDLHFNRQYICKLYNSTEFTFDIASKEDKTFVMCRAVFTDRGSDTKTDETLTPEQLKEKTEEKLKLDKKADDFTARHMGWAYEIPDYKAKYLTTNMVNLLENKEETEVIEIPDPNVILNTIPQGDLP